MVPHPSAPQCQGERLGRQRLCGKCLRIPCPGHQFPSFQSSSLGWWLSVVPPWSLPFLLKHKGERFSDIRKSQWGKKALKLFLWAEVLHRKCFFLRMCSCCHLVEHLYLYRHELLVQLEFACVCKAFFLFMLAMSKLQDRTYRLVWGMNSQPSQKSPGCCRPSDRRRSVRDQS